MPDWTMNRRLAIWIALPVVLFTAIFIAFLFGQMRTSSAPVDEGPGLEKTALGDLQSEATEACKCARVMTNAKGIKACWTHFDARIAKIPHGVQASSCDPVAEQAICFGKGDCVVTGYDVSGKGGLLCTREEALTAEAVFTSALQRRERDKTAEEPDSALARAVAALARGEAVSRPAAAPGCVPAGGG